MKKENKILSILIGMGITLFGMFILSKPISTLLAIISLMAWAVLLRGCFFLYDSYANYKRENDINKVELLYGIILLLLGIIFLTNPSFTSSLVFYMVALWFIIDGVAGIYSALNQSNIMKYFNLVLGILLVFFGFSIAIEPIRALFTLNILIGISIMTNGIQMISSQFLKK
ncbi:DUF308 domain-containing protein [Anaerococcus sp. AGMB00486]|uniref:DUF308 domain-containing protein n=2 Tax=Anaerococcus TaxID=165779 RepID=A0ABX2N7X4_9FIRM|nr:MULTISPECIES: DUF308 domain-containing protein [Anaerococcus]MSS78341.1 permease [Anaerococcus porci]NVF10753.1 DUF308 domain-containing protein [Anaerococcus faecalis]